MEAPERIEGERVYLRRIQPVEAAAILAGVLPPHLTFSQGYPAANSFEVMDILVGSRREASPTFLPFFVVRTEDDVVVGEAGWSCPDGPESPDVGYDIVEPLWGRGYATDALRAIISYLLSLPHVERVCANTTKTNLASRRVIEKAGMRPVREASEEVDGEVVEVLYFEIAGATSEGLPR